MPSVAVQTGPDGTYVYVVTPDQTVELRPVTVARVAGAEATIATGLAAGDTVVVDAHQRLVPGGRVTQRDGSAPNAGS